MKTPSDFFQKLSSLSSYAEQVELMRPVTHSTRMAMLWLYVQKGLIPPEDFKCRPEELRFLWQYMPSTTDVRSVPRLQAAARAHLDYDRIQVVTMWVNQRKFSAPIMQDNLVPGMSQALLLTMFEELLKVHLQPKRTEEGAIVTT